MDPHLPRWLTILYVNPPSVSLTLIDIRLYIRRCGRPHLHSSSDLQFVIIELESPCLPSHDTLVIVVDFLVFVVDSPSVEGTHSEVPASLVSSLTISSHNKCQKEEDHHVCIPRLMQPTQISHADSHQDCHQGLLEHRARVREHRILGQQAQVEDLQSPPLRSRAPFQSPPLRGRASFQSPPPGG